MSIEPLDLYVDDLLSAEYQDQSAIAQFDVGANFLQYGQARLGLAIGERRFSQQSGSVALPSSGTTNIRAAAFDLKLDQLTGVNFPTGGWRRRRTCTRSSARSAATTRTTAGVRGDRPPPRPGRHTFEGRLSAAGKLGSNDDPDLRPVRTRRIPAAVGTCTGQLRSQDYQFVRLGYRTKLARHPAVRGRVLRRVAGGGTREAVHSRLAGESVDGRVTIPAGALYVGIDSPLGPLYLGFGYSSRDHSAVYLYLGRP